MDLQYVGMACAAIIFIVLVILAISLIRWLNASAAKKKQNTTELTEEEKKLIEEFRKQKARETNEKK